MDQSRSRVVNKSMDNTALPLSESIWSKVSRTAFENDIDVLANHKSYVPGERDYTDETEQNSGFNSVLPLELERRLADDFAFISSNDFGVEYVTAATVKQSTDPLGLTICLAANEGIRAEVYQEMLKILEKLKLCSTKRSGVLSASCIAWLTSNTGLQQRDCEEDIFDIIVNLNINKIFGRLSSKHFVRPRHMKGPGRESLNVELDRFATRVFASRRHKSPAVNTFFGDLSSFQRCFLNIEESFREDAFHEVKLAIKAAYQMRQRKISFYRHLESLGLIGSELDVHVVREIDKLSNYWRISRDLACICTRNRRYRSCRPLFNHMTLNRVPHHSPVSSADTLVCAKRFVHAEIQMLIYHESDRSQGLPRIIGSSKAACYLCDAFIRAHSIFQISKAHRQVYNKWTVPESPRLDRQALDRFRVALERVSGDVRRELSLARGSHQRKRYPFQSWINLHNTVISTSSNSTVTSLLQSQDKHQPDTRRSRLSTSATTSVDTERVSCPPPFPMSIRKEDTDQHGTSGPLGLSASDLRSASRPRSPTLGDDLLVTVSNTSSISPRRCTGTTSSLSVAKSTQCFPKPDSNAPTASIAATSITDRTYSLKGKAHAQQKGSKGDFSKQEGSIASARAALQDGLTGSSLDGHSNDSTSVYVESSKQGVSHRVRSSSPRELRVGRFHLHIYLEEGSRDCANTYASIEANYRLPRDSNGDQAPGAITLALGQERVVSWRDPALGHRTQVTIGDDHGGVVDMFCTWHDAIAEDA